MGHEGLFATSAEIIIKAGDNYPSTLGDETAINALCLQVESYINVETGYDWSGEFTAPATTTLSATKWHILGEAESNLVAIYLLNIKPSGEDGTMSRIEYEDRINILFARFVQCMDIMTDLGTEKFIKGA